MAIEIKELHVKLHMDEAETTATKSDEAKKNTDGCCEDSTTQEVLVENITNEVLRILKEQKER